MASQAGAIYGRRFRNPRVGMVRNPNIGQYLRSRAATREERDYRNRMTEINRKRLAFEKAMAKRNYELALEQQEAQEDQAKRAQMMGLAKLGGAALLGTKTGQGLMGSLFSGSGAQEAVTSPTLLPVAGTTQQGVIPSETPGMSAAYADPTMQGQPAQSSWMNNFGSWQNYMMPGMLGLGAGMLGGGDIGKGALWGAGAGALGNMFLQGNLPKWFGGGGMDWYKLGASTLTGGLGGALGGVLGGLF